MITNDYKSIYEHQFPKEKPEVHIYFTTVQFMPGAPNILYPVSLFIYLTQKFSSVETKSQVNHTLVSYAILYTTRLFKILMNILVNVLCGDVFLSFISRNNPTSNVPMNYPQISLLSECWYTDEYLNIYCENRVLIYQGNIDVGKITPWMEYFLILVA